MDKDPESYITVNDTSYRLVKTCSSCPEQYDVYKSVDGDANWTIQVGYLRLRHGVFTAETPDVGGHLVYLAKGVGDGCFESEETRQLALFNAVRAIHEFMLCIEQEKKVHS